MNLTTLTTCILYICSKYAWNICDCTSSNQPPSFNVCVANDYVWYKQLTLKKTMLINEDLGFASDAQTPWNFPYETR